MKTLLVVNPAAGHGRGKKVFERLEPRLRAETFPGLEVRISEYPGHAVEIGREAARAGYDRILCLGGDGTPYEVINGLYADGRPARLPEIGQIPAGTGNSFLRDFDITTPDEALDTILAGRRRKVDLVEFTYREDRAERQTVRRYSLNIIGVGLIADILQLTNERLKFLGSAGYSLAVLVRLIRGMSNRIAIEADGRRLEVAEQRARRLQLEVHRRQDEDRPARRHHPTAGPTSSSSTASTAARSSPSSPASSPASTWPTPRSRRSRPPRSRSSPDPAAPADGRRRAHRLDARSGSRSFRRARSPGLTVRL